MRWQFVHCPLPSKIALPLAASPGGGGTTGAGGPPRCASNTPALKMNPQIFQFDIQLPRFATIPSRAPQNQRDVTEKLHSADHHPNLKCTQSRVSLFWERE